MIMIQSIPKARYVLPLVLLLTVSMGALGCGLLERMSNTEKGAAGGAAGGAVVGGVIGNTQGSTAKGAIIGAVIGGTAGAIIGREMDKQAEEIEENVEGAEVERVAEGIQVTFDNAILFDFDSADLRPTARRNLANLAENLRQYEGQRELLIVGHTDSTGPEDYNQSLSERRARAAANYLMQQGVSTRYISTVGRGETEPVASNSTSQGRQENRRVEVAITASDEYRESLQRQQG